MNSNDNNTQAFEDITENSIEIICPECSSVISYELDDFNGGNIFCPECGSTIELDDRIEIVCSSCNHSVNVFTKYFSDGKVFCPECGNELEVNDCTNTISCFNCGNDVSYKPDEVIDNSVKCEKCGKKLIIGEENTSDEEYDSTLPFEEYTDDELFDDEEYDNEEYFDEECNDTEFDDEDEFVAEEEYIPDSNEPPAVVSLKKENDFEAETDIPSTAGTNAFEEITDEKNTESEEEVQEKRKRPVAWFDSFYEDEEEVLDFTSNFAEGLPEWDIVPPSIPVKRLSAISH
ncbi:MAG: zinc ribbon domain-containing protein [Oscillospiraceae bacterium]|nr:zinc ribbon domain-containing protein [Oscillospiraceae bacterium]